MNSSRSPVAAGNVDGLADALHLQRLYKSLRLNYVLDYVESVISEPISELDTDSEDDQLVGSFSRHKSWNGDSNVYNWSSIQKKRRWVCDALQHSSDSEDSEYSLTCSSSLPSGFAGGQRRRQSRGKTQPVASSEDDVEEDLDEFADETRLNNDVEVASVKKELRFGEEKEEAGQFENQTVGNGSQRHVFCSGTDGQVVKAIKLEGASGVLDSKDVKDNYKVANYVANDDHIGNDRKENATNNGPASSSERKWKDETLPPCAGEAEIKQEIDDEELKQRSALDDEEDSVGGETDDEATDDSDERTEDDDDDDDDSDEREETDESECNEKESSGGGRVLSHGNLQNHRGTPTAGLASTTSSARQSNVRRIDALIREHLLRKSHACDYQALDDGVVTESGESSSKTRSFLYYGAGLVSNVDRYSDHQRYMACSRRARGNFSRYRGGGVAASGGAGAAYGAEMGALAPGGGGSLTVREDQRRSQATPSLQSSSSQVTVKEEDLDESGLLDQNNDSLMSMTGEDADEGLPEHGGDPSKLRARASARREKKGKKLDAQALAVRRHKLWLVMARKEVVRQQRTRAAAHKETLHNCKRVAVAAMKFSRQKALQSQKVVKDKQWLLKRLCRSMQTEWKKFDRIVKEQNKRAEREAEEQRKMDKEIMEAKRQQRKVNFLITLPELYAHFMQNKMTGAGDTVDDTSTDILRQLEDAHPSPTTVTDDYDSEVLKAQALQTAQEAVRCQQARLNKFGSNAPSAAASSEGPARAKEWPQPDIFMGQLKSYQMKGMNWIANLYYFGINGILADEMGLGKTVQAVAFLAHICEEYDTWGPFLIVTPASTLHNWTEEIARFVPEFKVVPYWGTPEERKLLRKFFDTKDSGERRNASFHVVVTSYHIVIQDFKFLNRLKWNYMVLDEAQAIKSIQSQRWKLLLGFSCRNRLLLSGTPIQNTMAELWALLHFIMPALFDSHQWFNEWFSKDIEGHVENRTHVDEKHLNRLHTILKPFMLRRIKTEVENELTDKIEIMVYCPLTLRQKFLYSGLKNKISIEELLHSSSGSSAAQSSVTTSLMNLVMQFRKVCNHPELLERREVQSPLFLNPEATLLPRLVYQLALEPRHLTAKLSPSSPYHIHGQLHTDLSATRDTSNNTRDPWLGSWWFASLCGLSVHEVSRLMRGNDLTVLWQLWYRQFQHRDKLARHRLLWHRRPSSSAERPILIDYKNQITDWSEGVIQMASCSGLPSSSHMPVGRNDITTSSQTFASEHFLPINPRLDSLVLPGRDYGSGALQSLVFCSHTTSFYTFTDHVIHRMPETTPHRLLRESKLRRPLIEEVAASDSLAASSCSPDTPSVAPDTLASGPGGSNTSSVGSSTLAPDQDEPMTHKTALLPVKSPIKEEIPEGVPTEGDCSGMVEDESGSPMPPAPPLPKLYHPPTTRYLQPTFTPHFITHTCPKVVCSARRPYCFDPHASDCGVRARRDPLLDILLRGVDATLEQHSSAGPLSCSLQAEDKGGLAAISPVTAGWNNVLIPDKHSLMMDAGKLFVLDSLLRRMKAAGNRVLIYSQMTKMINLLEEYMRHRQHKYMRLDGSSKISDRRDMVADFQTKSDIFVFLLSTRAGGVGINLTAADTVIFYDSDWNPTVDQQAMDRAHRVGQTKQVTVYRLICKATIEERILQRAKEKSEIQRMVISGGNFKPDTLKPKEVVSLLLEDDIEQQFRARQNERRALDEQRVEYNRVKMRKRYAEKKLERVQQECKRRRVEDESSPIDVCGSPAPSPARSDSSEEHSILAPMDISSSSHLPASSEDATHGGPSADPPEHSTDAADAALAAAPLIAAPALSNTTVRGHRKRGRPRMNGVRGRSGARTPHSAPVAAVPGSSGVPGGPGGVPVKRGRGRPRLLPLGPGHQGQRPLQQLPAALGALQLRGTDDTAPHGP